MSCCPILLISFLLLLYFILSFIIAEIENPEEVFIDSITWYGNTISLGDEVTVQTTEGLTEGFFRGSITGKSPTLRLSCEGRPRVEIPWQDIIAIEKIT